MLIKHNLFAEIQKFIDWADSNYDLPHDEIGYEWECDYPEWQSIYDAFVQFIRDTEAYEWSNEEQEKLLYIIARDNESEFISENLPEDALLKLTQTAVIKAPDDAKWQLIIQLHRLQDKKAAFSYLEIFITDPHEYVVRRTLMEMAKMKHPRTEEYCQKLWDKNTYGEMEEYQRIAILFSLHEIKSERLLYYLEQAKTGGGKYLVNAALKIKAEIS